MMADSNNENQNTQKNNDYFKFVITIIILAVGLLIATPILTILATKYMQPDNEKAVTSSEKFNDDVGRIDLGKVRSNIAGTHGEKWVEATIVIHVTQITETKSYFEQMSADNKNGMKSIVQAELLEILGSKTFPQLEKKQPIADQIKKRLNTFLTERKAPGIVNKVLFTTFIYQ